MEIIRLKIVYDNKFLYCKICIGWDIIWDCFFFFMVDFVFISYNL